MNAMESAVALCLMGAAMVNVLGREMERPTPQSWLRLGGSFLLLGVAMLYIFGVLHIGRR